VPKELLANFDMKMFSEMIGQKNESYFDPKVVLT
jgi:hypothetical protein